MSALSTSSAFSKSVTRRVAAPKAIRSRQVTRAVGDTQLVISASTAVMLALGRFVGLPYQRRTAAKSVPTQNGVTHAAAGDSLAQEATFVLKSNDPEGFNIIDVMAYGSLGHAIGFFLLAAASLGTKPIPF